jgi:hypothetical protein
MMAILVQTAFANHGAAVFTSATCDPSTNTITVFATNTSGESAGFAAWISIDGGAPFLSDIIFDGTEGALDPFETGSYVITNPGFVSGVVVVITNESPFPPGGGVSVTANCGPQEVGIDIKPGSSSNTINIARPASVAVAILSNETFDAPAEVDAGSLTFGATGEENSLRWNRNGTPKCWTADVDNNGYDDLVCEFDVKKAAFSSGDTEGILIGSLNGGDPIQGTDSVNIT